MRTLVLLLTLMAACASEVLPLEELESEPVAVSVDALQGPDYTYTNSNNGTDCRSQSGSYKARALCTYIKMFAGSNPSNMHNQFTCGADTCTANITFTFGGTPVTAGTQFRASSCFDLPSCSGWACRQCDVTAGGTHWYAHTLQYQQGFGQAKLFWGTCGGAGCEFGNAFISDASTSKFTRTAP